MTHHLTSAQHWDRPAGGNTARLFLTFGGPVCADRISNCPLDRMFLRNKIEDLVFGAFISLVIAFKASICIGSKKPYTESKNPLRCGLDWDHKIAQFAFFCLLSPLLLLLELLNVLGGNRKSYTVYQLESPPPVKLET